HRLTSNLKTHGTLRKKTRHTVFRRLQKDTRGTVAVLFGILAFPTMLAIGGAVDFTTLLQQRARLQSAADATALATALELGLASTQPSQIQAIAEEYASINLASKESLSGAPVDVATDIKASGREIEVKLSYAWTPVFASFVFDEVSEISATATAGLAGNETICVLALSDNPSRGINMLRSAQVTANNCGIFSNSVSPEGIVVNTSSTLSGSSIYSSGGFVGALNSFSPQPVTDAPPIADPLAERAPPVPEACQPSKTNLSFTNGFRTLDPGTYCGGINVGGKATLNLNPGVYIIRDGPLTIRGNATLQGDHVGFYFTGDDAAFEFGTSTQINVTAPSDGVMAGILFFEDRSAPIGRRFIMRSKDAERFEGTVYLPRGEFFVDKKSRVGQKSNWTAIIVQDFRVGEGPNIEVNSDFAASDVPVPEGIVPNSGRVLLLQ
ncbi:MAG: TadE/TadG family type IV pilus assembly protein, partial [Pseudomonadota bacterium]